MQQITTDDIFGIDSAPKKKRELKFKPRKCDVCGEEFEKTGSRQLYCSDKCLKAGQKILYYQKQLKEKKKEVRAARDDREAMPSIPTVFVEPAEQDFHYRTSDMWEAAYLRCKGFKIQGVEDKDNFGSKNFLFEAQSVQQYDQIVEFSEIFHAGDIGDPKLIVNVRVFYESVKIAKDLLFHGPKSTY